MLWAFAVTFETMRPPTKRASPAKMAIKITVSTGPSPRSSSARRVAKTRDRTMRYWIIWRSYMPVLSVCWAGNASRFTNPRPFSEPVEDLHQRWEAEQGDEPQHQQHDREGHPFVGRLSGTFDVGQAPVAHRFGLGGQRCPHPCPFGAGEVGADGEDVEEGAEGVAEGASPGGRPGPQAERWVEEAGGGESDRAPQREGDRDGRAGDGQEGGEGRRPDEPDDGSGDALDEVLGGGDPDELQVGRGPVGETPAGVAAQERLPAQPGGERDAMSPVALRRGRPGPPVEVGQDPPKRLRRGLDPRHQEEQPGAETEADQQGGSHRSAPGTAMAAVRNRSGPTNWLIFA